MALIDHPYGTGTFLVFLGLGFGSLLLGRNFWRDRARFEAQGKWSIYKSRALGLYLNAGVSFIIALVIAIREPLF